MPSSRSTRRPTVEQQNRAKESPHLAKLPPRLAQRLKSRHNPLSGLVSIAGPLQRVNA